MKIALRLSRQISRRKTAWGKRKAILKWCAEVKKFLSGSGEIGL